MNKREFNEIYNYLQNRPAEAARFLDMLEKAKTFQSSREAGEEIGRKNCDGIVSIHYADEHSGADSIKGWMTAKQVGDEIGMSARWVRNRIGMLPDEWIKQVGMTGKWMLHPMSVSAMRRVLNSNQ